MPIEAIMINIIINYGNSVNRNHYYLGLFSFYSQTYSKKAPVLGITGAFGQQL
jgi:hypothetical protein